MGVSAPGLPPRVGRLPGIWLPPAAGVPGPAPDPQPPVNIVAPSITGSAIVGQTLTVVPGTWTGDDPITLTYQWQRDGVDIPGATAETYALVDADETHTIDVVETGTNAVDSDSATSAATSAVQPDTAGNFATQTFAAADGTLLQALSGMVKHAVATNDATVTSNRARATASSGLVQALYYDSATPPSADYDVTTTLALRTDNGSSAAGPVARLDTAAASGYWARYSTANDSVELFKLTAGSQSKLGPTVAMAIPTELTIRCRGDQISVLADGVEVIAPVTDATYAGPGQAGLRFTGTPGASVGVHIDKLAASASQFVNQPFTAADGTTAQSLANMVKHPLATNDAVVTSNRMRAAASSGGAQALYHDDAVPASADYETTATLALISDNNSSSAGPFARLDPDAFSGYWASYSTANDSVELFKYIDGSRSRLGSPVAMAIPTDLTLRCVGDQITVLADDVEVVGPITDGDPITATGRAGFRFAGTPGATVGIHIDTLIATTDVSADPPPTGAVAAFTASQSLATTTQLDASSSTGDSYAWKLDGVALADTGAQPTIVTTLGEHTVELTVTDSASSTSDVLEQTFEVVWRGWPGGAQKEASASNGQGWPSPVIQPLGPFVTLGAIRHNDADPANGVLDSFTQQPWGMSYRLRAGDQPQPGGGDRVIASLTDGGYDWALAGSSVAIDVQGNDDGLVRFNRFGYRLPSGSDPLDHYNTLYECRSNDGDAKWSLIPDVTFVGLYLGGPRLKTTPIVRDRWEDFIWEYRMSTDPAVGYVRVWKLNASTGVWENFTLGVAGANAEGQVFYATMNNVSGVAQKNTLAAKWYRSPTVLLDGFIDYRNWNIALTMEAAVADQAPAE